MAETSQTVDQALQVLVSVYESGPDKISGLAKRLGLNRTVTHRLVASLRKYGMLRLDGYGRCQLGATILTLAAAAWPVLRSISELPLRQLVEISNETAVLMVLDGPEIVPLLQFSSNHHAFRIELNPGSRRTPWETAPGLAILAWLEPERAVNVIDSSENPRALRKAVDTVRAAGFAEVHDEHRTGTSSIAAPIYAPNGHVVGSLGIVMPPRRLAAASLLVPSIVELARRLTAELEAGLAVDLKPTVEPASAPARKPRARKVVKR